METSDSIVNIAKALLEAQKEMGNAVKGAENPFFKSTYADLNAVREAAMPALNKNSIVVLQPTVERNGAHYVETVLLHSSGEYLSGLTEIRSAKPNDPQSMGSGISYSRRYGLQSILSIGAEDDDAESATVRPKVPDQTSQAKGKDYVIPFGNLTGKKLGDLPESELKKLYEWCKGKTGAAITVRQEIERFMK